MIRLNSGTLAMELYWDEGRILEFSVAEIARHR